MFQQYFHHKGIVTLPILTMLLFATVFVVMLVRALRSGPDDQIARLPLQPDEDGTATTAVDGGSHE